MDKKYILWIVVFFLMTIPLFSEILPGLASNPPLSPVLSSNAESLKNIDVDLFHGTNHVSIPLFEYRIKDLSIPISLSYTTPRELNRNTYHSDWTGLGWRLEAGGAITRSVKGEVDEIVQAPTSPYNYVWTSDIEHCDPNEDVFTFNFCGYSGTFYYSVSSNTWLISSKDHFLDLVPILDQSNHYINGFKIRMPNGITYSFGYTSSVAYSEQDMSSVEGAVTWYLTKIESLDGNYISFNYQKAEPTISLPVDVALTKISAVYTESSSPVSYSYYKEIPFVQESGCLSTTPSYLSSISSSDGMVNVFFDRSVAHDLDYPDNLYPASYLGSKSSYKWYKLDAIRMIDNTISGGRCFKKFNLGYIENNTEVLKLSSLKESGFNQNNVEISKPDYTFTYKNQNTTAGIDLVALDKMVYPTGGFVTFEYGAHEYNDLPPTMTLLGTVYPVQWTSPSCLGVRINKVSSYSAVNETPTVVEYKYTGEYNHPNTEDFQNITGEISRTRQTNKEVYFDAYIGRVHWTKTTSYDMASAYTSVPNPDVVGYSSVHVVKSRGEGSVSDDQNYVFNNYSNYSNCGFAIWYNNQNQKFINDGQRMSYAPVGDLLRSSNSQQCLDYNYDDPQCPTETISHTFTEYLPFIYNGDTYSYKSLTGITSYWQSKKPKQITEYEKGSMYVKLAITTFTYNPVTGNIERKETVNQKDGNIYTVDYKYEYTTMLDILHNGAQKVDIPYEIITRKNGNVIASEVTLFTNADISGQAFFPFQRPWKKYVLDSATPISDYKSPSGFGTTDLDSRMKLVKTYGYYPNGDLYSSQLTGQEPVYYEWDNYGRLLSKRVADMKTSYTYNVYGLTSVTEPTGAGQQIEYDAFGQPTVVKDENGNVVQSIKYEYNINP